MDKPKCRVCGTGHWSSEPHVWADAPAAKRSAKRPAGNITSAASVTLQPSDHASSNVTDKQTIDRLLKRIAELESRPPGGECPVCAKQQQRNRDRVAAHRARKAKA